MDLPAAILIVCESDLLFREALRNFLLAAGYPGVRIVETVRVALATFRVENGGAVLVSLSRPAATNLRLARVARRRRPEAKILLVIRAFDSPSFADASFVCVIKERAFSTLLELLSP